MRDNPFELYDNPGWEDASKDIAAVIKAQVNLVNTRKIDVEDAVKEIGAVLRKYEPWGATAAKTRNIVSSRMCDGVKWA